MPDLRVTRRALSNDFGLSAESLAWAVEDYCNEHPVLQAFLEQRSQNPIGQETTQLPRSKQIAYNLHRARFRGLTWHDEEDDVVWLLGFGFHETGSRDDAYELLKALDAKGELLPDEGDYEALYRWRHERGVSNLDDLIELVYRNGPKLLESGLGQIGNLIKETFANALEVKLLVQEEDGGDIILRTYTVTFAMPPLRSGLLPSGSNWQLLLIFSFLPKSADVGDLEWHTDAAGDTVIYYEVFPSE